MQRKGGDSNTAAILLDGDIRDRVRQKDQRSAARIQGFDVFLEGFSRALITRSQHGPVVLPREAMASFLAQPPAWLAGSRDRIEAISSFDSGALAGINQLLLLSVGPEMLQYAWLREEIGRPDWPITAILHSPQPVPRIRYLFTNHLMGRLGSHDALVCPSKAARDAIRAAFAAVPQSLRSTSELPMNLPVIPMGVDVPSSSRRTREAARLALGLPVDQQVLLWFGRLAPGDKGEMLPFLRALAPCLVRHNARLVIGGDDTTHRMAGTLQELSIELGYGDRLTVLPDVSQKQKELLFDASSAFLALTDSMHEGFSLTIAEAMAHGLPVIASDWAGHREYVNEGITGRLIRTYMASDPAVRLITLYSGMAQESRWELSTAIDLEMLSSAVDDLLSNPDTARWMGDNAYRFARDTLDWSVVMAEYDSLWSEQLSRSAASHRKSVAFPKSSFGQVFATYPTRTMHEADVLAVPKGSLTEADLPALGHTQHFQHELLARLLEVCGRASDGTTFGQIAQTLVSEGVGIAEIERHVGRLLKHGFLRIEPFDIDSAKGTIPPHLIEKTAK
ncbi:glycosyltransferase family 4 protein [Luteibacter sp. HA06]